MGTIDKHMIFNRESQTLPQIKASQPPLHTSGNIFPVLPIAVLCIIVTAFLLIIYYILLAKCCFNWQQLDPLHCFSLLRPPQSTGNPLTAYSTSLQSHGLDELLIREIPIFQYSKMGGQCEEFVYKCVVCLSEFQQQDTLRVLPKCGHGFHLDCIDVWLQSNTNCPLCRSGISGVTRCQTDRIVAPTSSPRDPLDTHLGGDEDFVVIELTSGVEENEIVPNTRLPERNDPGEAQRKFDELNGENTKQGKFRRVSIIGDECIHVMREKDDQFSVHPIRRSFSFDSAANPRFFLTVQEMTGQSGNQSDVTINREEESSSRVRISFFPFGNGRGSRSTVLPIEF